MRFSDWSSDVCSSYVERRAGLLQKDSPALLAEPIAVTADCDHGAVVQQAIQDGGGDHRVAEHRAPLGDRAVRGEQDRAALVTPADQLEEQGGGVRLERTVAELVDDQQLRPGVEIGRASCRDRVCTYVEVKVDHAK